MRELIPLTFTELGPTEFVWLLLAVAGLSLAASPGRRIKPALWSAVILVVAGIVRMLVATVFREYFDDDIGSDAWNRWLGPAIVGPLLTAAAVYGGGLLCGRRFLGRIWIAALVLWSLALRPWGRDPVADAHEWLFLALIALALCAFLQRDGPAARLLARRLGGRVRGVWVAVAAFFALCVATEPFGVGWRGALGLLFLAWLTSAVLEQGREMRKYVLRRLIGAPFVLFLVMVLSFGIIRAAPGGPFDKDKRVAPEIKELLNRQHGYDEPLPKQLGLYLLKFFWEGSLGSSTKQIGKTANEIIGHHMKPSIQLALSAVALALLIGLTAGLISGIRRNSIFDYASMAGAMLGLALPTFIVGPMLVLLFAMKLDWFNVAGWEDFPKDLVLPAITLSLPFAARIARLTRAGMLEIVNQDYIRTARAKGLSEPVIVIRHTLKGTLLPVVSFLGPAIAQLLTGSLVVEKIFSVPGLGSEFVNSALNRDYSLAMGLVVLFGSLLIFFNLVVDVLYAFLDPRIRHG